MTDQHSGEDDDSLEWALDVLTYERELCEDGRGDRARSNQLARVGIRSLIRSADIDGLEALMLPTELQDPLGWGVDALTHSHLYNLDLRFGDLLRYLIKSGNSPGLDELMIQNAALNAYDRQELEAQEREQARKLEHVCPGCHAQPQEPCRTKSGVLTWPHARRGATS